MTVRAARLLGAGRVIAAARNQEIMNTLGADATIDLRLPKEELKQAFAREAARGIDLVVDFVWGPAAEALIEALVRPDLIASGGGEIRFVQVGSMGGDAITLNFGALRGARLTLLGSGTGNFPPPERMRSLIAEILERAAKREIGVEVARRPLSEIAEAWTAKEDERRIVLMV
ncbi:MAG: hypothetical protein JO288_11740 [Hyphomicrobiales bacterium]|nr:hypothetical protein [Hyphomicrobiales bacterium]